MTTIPHNIRERIAAGASRTRLGGVAQMVMGGVNSEKTPQMRISRRYTLSKTGGTRFVASVHTTGRRRLAACRFAFSWRAGCSRLLFGNNGKPFMPRGIETEKENENEQTDNDDWRGGCCRRRVGR